MNEIETLKNAINPNETLFVVDSMTGMEALLKLLFANGAFGVKAVAVAAADGTPDYEAAMYARLCRPCTVLSIFSCCCNELLFSLRCPGIRASAPSGRAAAMNFSFLCVALG